MKYNQSGFSLIEIATVMVIIGLIAGGSVMLSNNLIQSSHAKEVIAMVTDMSIAIKNFKDRYHYFPGDLPGANADIAAVTASGVCDYSNTDSPTNSLGNGEIGTDAITNKNTEVDCVTDHLYSSGLIRTDSTTTRTRFGTIRVIVKSDSNFAAIAMDGNPKHIIELTNVPLDIAQEIDRTLDNDDVTSGRLRGSEATAVDPIPFYAVPL
ncbi:MAG: prepilin-type N-terminal cleavage/methylation domain-containing protein [Magnetococcales bacterium]|nr:prepilin-type N-terminal cleavage/methylation domain-containing protein [Magnetococcales bacterium]